MLLLNSEPRSRLLGGIWFWSFLVASEVIMMDCGVCTLASWGEVLWSDFEHCDSAIHVLLNVLTVPQYCNIKNLVSFSRSMTYLGFPSSLKECFRNDMKQIQ